MKRPMILFEQGRPTRRARFARTLAWGLGCALWASVAGASAAGAEPETPPAKLAPEAGASLPPELLKLPEVPSRVKRILGRVPDFPPVLAPEVPTPGFGEGAAAADLALEGQRRQAAVGTGDTLRDRDRAVVIHLELPF